MNAQSHQTSYFGAWLSPLTPVGHANSAPYPMIQIDENNRGQTTVFSEIYS